MGSAGLIAGKYYHLLPSQQLAKYKESLNVVGHEPVEFDLGNPVHYGIRL